MDHSSAKSTPPWGCQAARTLALPGWKWSHVGLSRAGAHLITASRANPTCHDRRCRRIPNAAVLNEEQRCRPSSRGPPHFDHREAAGCSQPNASPGFAWRVGRILAQKALPLMLAVAFGMPVLAFPQHAQTDWSTGTVLQRVDARAGELASGRQEDLLMEALKQAEAQIDSAVSAILRHLPHLNPASAEQSRAADEEAAIEEGRELVREVWGVVADHYLDARSAGFDLDRWTALRDRYLDRMSPDPEAAFRAVREMLAFGLSDPYTRFVTPAEFKEMRRYDITGVGLNLGTGTDFVAKTGIPLPHDRTDRQAGVWVVGLIRGLAAEAAGVRQGDEIVAVDGRPTEGLSPFQVASLILGAPSGDAPAAASQRPPNLSLLVRKADGREETLRLRRPVRSVTSPVSAHLQDRGARKVGYIRLASLPARAQQDVARAVRSLAADGAQEFELDLRANRGGLVQEGIEIARLFLDDGSTVVTTEGRGHRRDAVVRAAGPPLTTAPLTVLVDDHSASAAEIMAAALHDNCRALLVGKRTYGKGLIQSVYELSNSSGLIVTVGKYITPAGIDIDREGLQPDFERPPTPAEAAQRLAACRIPVPSA